MGLKSFFVVLMFFSTVAMAATGVKPEPQAVKRGKALYEKHCLVCHQKDGVGEPAPPLGIQHPDFIPAMPLNESSHAWHHGDEQLADAIINGLQHTKRMPAFKGTLSLDNAMDIVEYIKSLWSPRILACQGPKHMQCMRHGHH